MTKFPFTNDFTPRERRAELLKSGAGATYSRFAVSETDVVGGRYAAHTKSTVIGSGPVEHPRLPENLSSATQLPDEPPLGYAIDGPPEPVGEAHELIGVAVASSCGGVEAPSGSILPAEASETPSPPSHPKRGRRCR